MNLIDYQLGLKESYSNASGKWNYPASETKCPKGMIPYGDGSACKDRKETCAHTGNAGMVRCKFFVSKNPIECSGGRILLANGGCRDVAPTEGSGNNLESLSNTTQEENLRGEDTSKNSEESKGLSTGAKIGIGVGALVLIVGGVMLLRKRK